jgi:hypothetical protein
MAAGFPARPMMPAQEKGKRMAMYARSDVMALSLGEHGCGATHTRPVTHGAPSKVFQLDCPPCESHLRGDRKAKILRYETDKKTGKVMRQVRVADADPMWAGAPDTVPLTPDETHTNEVRSERGRMQIEMLQALAALRSTGVEVPAEAMWLLERELPAGVLKGTVICANGHDTPAGGAFCPQCGVSMAVRAAIGSGDEEPSEPALDLSKLHPQTLKKMCRAQKLPDTGTKDDLISRLAA